MIADDMMRYIKNDIIVFGIGVFIFIVCTLWFIFRNIKWCGNAFIRVLDISNSYDWFVRFNRLEGNCHIFKFYCSDVNS